MFIAKKKKLKPTTVCKKPPKRTKTEQELFMKDYNKKYNEIMNNLERKGLNTGGIYSRWAMDDAFHYAESEENKRKKKTKTNKNELIK